MADQMITSDRMITSLMTSLDRKRSRSWCQYV